MPHKGVIVDPDRIKVEAEAPKKKEAFLQLSKGKLERL